MAATALRRPVEVLTRGHAVHVAAIGIWTVVAVSLGPDVAARIRPRIRHAATTPR